MVVILRRSLVGAEALALNLQTLVPKKRPIKDEALTPWVHQDDSCRPVGIVGNTCVEIEHIDFGLVHFGSSAWSVNAVRFVSLAFVGMTGSLWRRKCCRRSRWRQMRRHGACRRQSRRLQMLLFGLHELIRTYVVDNVIDSRLCICIEPVGFRLHGMYRR